MEIGDLIKQDSDRLFVLDHECYVIFTGDSVEDERPFIRIGNWINLPVGIIPLIENIIITDLMMGDPSLEQFNIDVNHLTTNRYIGSALIVKRYLDFQKVFGLDLTNASIVDIDKDIPSFSREKIISDRDSFIGIFYTDGNFRVTHNRNVIFDFREVEEKNLHAPRVHDLLARQATDSARYAGCGLVYLEHNPFFFRNRSFFSYHFPRNYFEDFARLRIDPGQIKELILPSSNLINLTRFMKWKHRGAGKVRVFSDRKGDIDLLQRLFSGATVVRQDFQKMSRETGEGVRIQNYPGTYNLRLTYKKVRPASRDITFAYLKGLAGIQEILKEPLDFILAGHDVYAEAALLFKSTASPVVVLAGSDGLTDRLTSRGITVIHPGMHYEFRAYDRPEDLLGDIAAAVSDRSIIDDIARGELARIHEMDRALASGSGTPRPEEIKDLLNIKASLKACLQTTTDRRLSAEISRLLDSLGRTAGIGVLRGLHAPDFRVTLAFLRGSAVEFVEPAGPVEAAAHLHLLDEIGDGADGRIRSITDPGARAFYERVAADRKRLESLLRLFEKQQASYGEMPALNQAIRKKKEEYYEDTSLAGDDEVRKSLRRIWMKKALKIVLVPLIAALSILLVAGGVRFYRHHRASMQREAERKYTAELTEKYGIRVRDRDIFYYVNQVAVKNGYAPLAYRHVRFRNPHWIYPGNVFYMLDGERIVVKKGDTLWGISGKKLMKRAVDFYKTVDVMERKIAKGADVREEMRRARELAYTEEHRLQLEKISRRTGK